ncbi:MAG TPA: LytR C-terminal domain-containing protein [Actinomycetota bacterium]|nr:LytR C-terminal domain-containing protein [Actinomycetota bacterium]
MKNGGARLLVIGAAVLVGILLLAKGFQGFAAGGPTPQQSPTPGTSPSASPGGTQSPGSPGNGGGGPSPQQEGVLVAIYNATNTNGLAAAAYDDLKAKGYVLAGDLGNLPPANQTIIYYKDEQGKADAQHLKELAVKEAKIQKLPKNLPPEASIPKNAELVLVLGSDYAQSHPVSG